MLARRLNVGHALDGSRNGSVALASRDQPELARAIQLALRNAPAPGPTWQATQSIRACSPLMRDEFGTHHIVAHLAAKALRLVCSTA